MPTIYSISDIHGFYYEMMDTLNLVDLISNKDNRLILLGDYIDQGKHSYKVLKHIKSLEEEYPGQVIVLLGNHEEMFIDWYTQSDDLLWLSQDIGLVTVKSFFTEEQFEDFSTTLNNLKLSYSEMNEFFRQELIKNHQELLTWLLEKKSEPRFFETDYQIYVHAGICEEDEELWKHSTDPYDFTWKYPAQTGSFYKDIIAGHVSSATVANDESYLGKVFWDKQSHFYIDGETVRSKIIPLLKFNTDSKEYSSYEKQNDGLWTEYKIKSDD